VDDLRIAKVKRCDVLNCHLEEGFSPTWGPTVRRSGTMPTLRACQQTADPSLRSDWQSGNVARWADL